MLLTSSRVFFLRVIVSFLQIVLCVSWSGSVRIRDKQQNLKSRFETFFCVGRKKKKHWRFRTG